MNDDQRASSSQFGPYRHNQQGGRFGFDLAFLPVTFSTLWPCDGWWPNLEGSLYEEAIHFSNRDRGDWAVSLEPIGHRTGQPSRPNG